MRKYGIENFTFEVLQECMPEELDDLETYWIDKKDATNPNKGYNLTNGGAFSKPHKLYDEKVDEIISLLQNSDLSQQEIANKFEVTQRTISSINIGETWVKAGLTYPLRITKNTCEICGKPITYGSIRCTKCSGLLHRKVERPDREELKSLIRKLPFTQIGKVYGVTDNAVRKWCEKESLPSKAKEIKQYTDKEWETL